MKNVVGILGSPRKGGNTDILLDRALEGARSAGAETSKMVLNDLDFRPCQACGGCDGTGICTLDDDMRSVYKAVEEADGIAVASPVFFGSVSAQLKMMIDRFQCLWVNKNVLQYKIPRRKACRGIFVCTSSSDRADFFENSRKIVRNLFATIDVEYAGEVFCPGLDGGRTVLTNGDALKKAFELGIKLVRA